MGFQVVECYVFYFFVGAGFNLPEWIIAGGLKPALR